MIKENIELLKESKYLLETYSPSYCKNWEEGVGDCFNCESCRVFKCIEDLENEIKKLENNLH